MREGENKQRNKEKRDYREMRRNERKGAGVERNRESGIKEEREEKAEKEIEKIKKGRKRRKGREKREE